MTVEGGAAAILAASAAEAEALAASQREGGNVTPQGEGIQQSEYISLQLSTALARLAIAHDRKLQALTDRSTRL